MSAPMRIPGQRHTTRLAGSVLSVGDSLSFQFDSPPPNAWWRLWQYLLLGWRWRAITTDAWGFEIDT